MPCDLAAMNPWIWCHPQLDLYEFSISWEPECDKIVEAFEAEQRAARKRKLEQTYRPSFALAIYDLPEAPPAFHPKIPPKLFCQHVVVDISEKRKLAHCVADDGKNVRVQVTFEGKLKALDIPRSSVLGVADLTNVYVTFEHRGNSTTARVGTDKNTAKLTVFWHEPERKIDCTMKLSRERLVMHPSQELAFARDCRARALDA